MTSDNQSVFEISAADFELLVRSQLGFEHYSYREAEGKETLTKRNIDGKLDMFDIGVLEGYKNQLRYHPHQRLTLSTLLNKLCADGDLEPGTYTIIYE